MNGLKRKHFLNSIRISSPRRVLHERLMGISFGGCGMTGKRFGVVVFFLAVSMLTLNSGYVFAQGLVFIHFAGVLACLSAKFLDVQHSDSKGAAHAVVCH